MQIYKAINAIKPIKPLKYNSNNNQNKVLHTHNPYKHEILNIR